MKKALFIFTFSCISFFGYSQEESIQLIFRQSSDAAYTELFQGLKNNPVKFTEITAKVDSLEKAGKVLISTQEFIPIKKRIDSIDNSSINENLQEELKFKEFVNSKYVVVTDLLKNL